MPVIKFVPVHPDKLLEVAEMLIRQEASRDHKNEAIAALKYAADICAYVRGANYTPEAPHD